MRAWTPKHINDVQRLLLARSLVAHGARTRVIADWCGLSMVQVRSLFREMGASSAWGQGKRRRGPNPSSLRLMLSSDRWRNEAAGLISLCYIYGAMPIRPLRNPRRELPDVTRGECFVRAFDLYCGFCVGRRLDFDESMAIYVAVAVGNEIKADRCESCGALVIRDVEGLNRFRCSLCTEVERRRRPSLNG